MNPWKGSKTLESGNQDSVHLGNWESRNQKVQLSNHSQLCGAMKQNSG